MKRLAPGTSSEGYAVAVAFLGHLAWTIPELRGYLAEHLEAMDGELIPHLIMSDFRGAAEKLLAEEKNERLQTLLDVLEDSVGIGSPELDAVIQVSFVEELSTDERLLDMLGPKLRQSLR